MNTKTAIDVAAETAAKAAKWALSKVGCPYSQPGRLRKNVFDCSSLVARAYSAQGKRWFYGGNVPLSCQEVYDDEFELLWPTNYSDIGKKFGGRNVITMGTKPGDIQFMCTDKSTSRSNKITHVAMVDSKSTIVHARGRAYGVVTSPITTYSGKICAILRYNPSGTLRKGMRGYRTLALQRALVSAGIGVVVDGYFNAQTATAIEKLQNQRSITVTGQADSRVFEILGITTVYQNASPETTHMKEELVEILGETVNLRTGPGTDFMIAKIALAGETFKHPDVHGWMPILTENAVLWVSEKYVRIMQ